MDEEMLKSAHGRPLCWTARIAGTVLSVVASAYFVYHEVDFGSGLLTTAIVMWLFVLSVTPSLLAWWWHRSGGAFVLIVCLLYAEGAYAIIDREDFLHVVLPFSVLWAASGVLHLIVSLIEKKRSATADPP